MRALLIALDNTGRPARIYQFYETGPLENSKPSRDTLYHSLVRSRRGITDSAKQSRFVSIALGETSIKYTQCYVILPVRTGTDYFFYTVTRMLRLVAGKRNMS